MRPYQTKKYIIYFKCWNQ